MKTFIQSVQDRKNKRALNAESAKILSSFVQSNCTKIQNETVSIRIQGYEHLLVIRQNLVSAIGFLAELIPTTDKKDELLYSIETIVELLHDLELDDELIGLSDTITNLNELRS